MSKTLGPALLVVGIILVVAGRAAKESTAQGQVAGNRVARVDPSSTPATAPSALDEREVARLIAQLGDKDFNVREAATARLLTAGHAAISALKKAQQETRDEEVRSRLGTILTALPLWNGRETVAQYALRMGIKEAEFAQDLGNKVTMKMVLIPAGKFLMGSPETENVRNQDEVQHEVTISKPFYMGATHVTVDQFAAFVKDNGYKTDGEKDGSSWGFDIKDGKLDFKKVDGCSWHHPSFDQKGDHPVVQVSWNDVQAFCGWLSTKSGKTVVLPTEAQWEYACRAGTTTAYPWGDNPDDGKGWANCADQSLKKRLPNADLPPTFVFFTWDDGWVFTSPVASFQANAFGLYDMIGNAEQWCQDRDGEYGRGAATDPTGADTGHRRMLRGGSWNGSTRRCRSADRARADPSTRVWDGGFRVVVATD
jgi:formylglycine-generating enzyme